MFGLMKKYSDWGYTLNPLEWGSNIFNDCKNYFARKRWKKKYGEEMPKWANEPLTLDWLNSNEFLTWLSKRTPEQQKELAEKLLIINVELDRLYDAVEDEIVNRGGNPSINNGSKSE